jgi:hypothetical protein
MSDEEKAMVAYLATYPCECGGRHSLTGEANYTDPLSYETRCSNCRVRGWVGYTTIQKRRIIWAKDS